MFVNCGFLWSTSRGFESSILSRFCNEAWHRLVLIVLNIKLLAYYYISHLKTHDQSFYLDQSREKFVSKHKIRVVDKNINGLEIKRLDLNDDSTHSHHSTRSTVRRDAGRSKSSKSAKSNENYHHNYEKPKEVKKIIIKNDTEDEDSASPTKENRRKHSLSAERSTTPPLPKSAEKPNLKRKRSTVSPIKFDLNEESSKRRSKSGDRENGDRDIQDKEKERDRERHDENQQKISIKKTEKKYDNIPERE